MDDQTNRATPRHIVAALDASVRAIAKGNVHDARSVQAEARRMLADHERTQPAAPRSSPGKRPRRTRSA